MAYIEKSTGRYPVSEVEIRLAFSNTSFPTPFSPPEDFEYVFAAPAPAYNSLTESVIETAPVVSVKGHYEQSWSVVPLSAEVVQANIAAYGVQLRKNIVDAAMKRLDDFAATRNYGSILSACSYATSTIPKFLAEGSRAVALRDQTWTRLYEILAEIEAGQRPMPAGFSDLESDLPVLSWSA